MNKVFLPPTQLYSKEIIPDNNVNFIKNRIIPTNNYPSSRVHHIQGNHSSKKGEEKEEIIFLGSEFNLVSCNNNMSVLLRSRKDLTDLCLKALPNLQTFQEIIFINESTNRISSSKSLKKFKYHTGSLELNPRIPQI